MLSERIPHDKRCPVAKYESSECTCYVSEVAKLERVARAANKSLIMNTDMNGNLLNYELSHDSESHKELWDALGDLPEGALCASG